MQKSYQREKEDLQQCDNIRYITDAIGLEIGICLLACASSPVFGTLHCKGGFRLPPPPSPHNHRAWAAERDSFDVIRTVTARDRFQAK